MNNAIRRRSRSAVECNALFLLNSAGTDNVGGSSEENLQGRERGAHFAMLSFSGDRSLSVHTKLAPAKYLAVEVECCPNFRIDVGITDSTCFRGEI